MLSKFGRPFTNSLQRSDALETLRIFIITFVKSTPSSVIKKFFASERYSKSP